MLINLRFGGKQRIWKGRPFSGKWVWEKGILSGERLRADLGFRRFIEIYRGTSYPSGRKGAWLLFKAWWDSPFLKKFSRNPVTTAVIFCSQLVGMLFVAVDFIRLYSLPASELIPLDFREGGFILNDVIVQRMGHLAEEILIKG